MRVLHLVPSVGPGSGGMGAVALEMVRRQQSEGLEAVLWCVDPPEIAAGAGPPESIVPLPTWLPRRVAWSPSGERRARTHLTDLVHQHGLWTAQWRITAEYRRRGIPTVVAPHGSLEPGALQYSAWKKRLALAWFERDNLQAASCLHATSDSELLALRRLGFRAPIAIVPNAVGEDWLGSAGDAAAFRALHGIPADLRLMLFLSRLHAKKGLALLIDALSRTRDQLESWNLIIAGSDEEGHRAEIQERALRMGVRDVVRFVGPLYGAQKRAAYAAAELFVLPTRSENFGLVIAEALACGVPVITTHGAPWSELELHQCGWWVPVSADSIAAAVLDATRRSPSDLQRMGANGRALVQSKYLWSAANARTVALYRWLSGLADRPDFVVMD